MKRSLVALAVTSTLVAPSALALTQATPSSAAAMATCGSLTKSLMVAEGFKTATGPVVTNYNFSNASKNAANAVGQTRDFGKSAIVVSCVSPSDIKKLSQQAKLKTTGASGYMKYMVTQSAGSMTKTAVAGVSDYLDFGNGKEDGLGSTSKAGSVRLDAWVAGNYIFLTFLAPASSKPSMALTNFIHYTEHNF